MRYRRHDCGADMEAGPEDDVDGELLDKIRSSALSGADFYQVSRLVRLYRSRYMKRMFATALRFLRPRKRKS
jgi:hypothetical protein